MGYSRIPTCGCLSQRVLELICATVALSEIEYSIPTARHSARSLKRRSRMLSSSGGAVSGGAASIVEEGGSGASGTAMTGACGIIFRCMTLVSRVPIVSEMLHESIASCLHLCRSASSHSRSENAGSSVEKARGAELGRESARVLAAWKCLPCSCVSFCHFFRLFCSPGGGNDSAGCHDWSHRFCAPRQAASSRQSVDCGGRPAAAAASISASLRRLGMRAGHAKTAGHATVLRFFEVAGWPCP